MKNNKNAQYFVLSKQENLQPWHHNVASSHASNSAKKIEFHAKTETCHIAVIL